jgi:hypothetical protein
MATQRQIDANRRNASRSTGPRTLAGKAVSSRNALKHGLRARAILLPGENKRSFQRLFKVFRAEHRPVGPLQEILVEQMAVAYWKLARLARIESHLFHDKSTPTDLFGPVSEPYHFGLDEPVSRLHQHNSNPNQLITRVFLRDAASSNNLSRLSYYEMRLERSFYQAYHELQRLRPAPRASAPQNQD